MFNRKIFIGIVIALGICFSACENGETEITETSGETVTETVSEPAETDFAVTDYAGNEIPEDSEEYGAIVYFRRNGYRFDPYGYYLPYSDRLFIDMEDFQDGEIPLDGLKEKYLDEVSNIVVLNAGNNDLSFISRCRNLMWITLENYSGNTDFSFISDVEEREYIELILDNYKGGADFSSAAGCGNIGSICFENYGGGADLGFVGDFTDTHTLWIESFSEDADLSFISDCKNITTVILKNKSINAEALAEILKSSNINRLDVTVEDYSSADAELLMRAAPTCEISYSLDDSDWDYTKRPKEGTVFCANLFVTPSEQSEKWECKTSAAMAYTPETWIRNYHGSLVCTFTNHRGESVTVNSVRIYRDEEGNTSEMPFADGSTVLGIDFTLEPNVNADFDITEEMFPFSECETGIYKVVFDAEGEQLEQRFVINNADMDFLTEEQREIYQKAYEITTEYFGCSRNMSEEYADTHTTEDFLAEICEGYTYDYALSNALGRYIDENGDFIIIAADRGGNITTQGNFFMPVYSDENEVIFKTFVIRGLDEYPYYIWFEELNYHMVKTEEGWRFDNFQLWY